MIIMAEHSKRVKHLVLAASCLAIFVNPLAGSMLNLALGAIQTDFGCSEHELGWVSSVFFIVSVMCLLPASRLADIYGKKRTFIWGSIIGSIGAVCSIFSPNIVFLYVFRGITAVGTAFTSCTCVSMIADVYLPDERGGALGVNTACVYLGASLGPAIGGFFTDLFGWRSIFILLLPLMISSAFMITQYRENVISSPDEAFDSKGSMIYVTGITIMMFGLISLPELYAVAMMVIGTVIIIGFLKFESKEKHPIFHGEMFSNVAFRRSMVALFLNYAASFSVAFFLSRYLQGIGLLTATEAGIVMMIQPTVQVVFTLISGRLSDRMDKRILPTLGMIILCIGLAILLFTTDIDINYPAIYISQAVMGLGFGLFSAPNTNAVMSYVRAAQYNQASGMIAVFRQTGMMLSMGLATCLISIFMGTDTAIEPSNYEVFIDILRYAWVICISFSVVGIFFSWFRGTSDPDKH